MTIPHPSGDDKCRIMDLVFLHIPKKPTSSTVLIIVMVVFHCFAVFPSEPVDEDTVVGGGRVRIYTNFAVHILHILCRMHYGADRRELGPSFTTGSVDLTSKESRSCVCSGVIWSASAFVMIGTSSL